MSGTGEEYVRLARHIEGQSRLITQIFTTSVVASVALLGYFVKGLLEPAGVSKFGPLLLLTPLLIVVPSAYWISSLRREIFKWAMYIMVYLEDGEERRYETELEKYRDLPSKDRPLAERFAESESLTPLLLTYCGLFLLCGVCFGLALTEASMNLLWLLLLIPFVLVLAFWCRDFKHIPDKARKVYKHNWLAVRDGTQATQ